MGFPAERNFPGKQTRVEFRRKRRMGNLRVEF